MGIIKYKGYQSARPNDFNCTQFTFLNSNKPKRAGKNKFIAHNKSELIKAAEPEYPKCSIMMKAAEVLTARSEIQAVGIRVETKKIIPEAKIAVWSGIEGSKI